MNFEDFFWYGVRSEPNQFLFGLLLIVGFSLQQFSKPTFELSQLPVRFHGRLAELTTRPRYFCGATLYLLGMIFIFAMLCWAVGILKTEYEDSNAVVLEWIGIPNDFGIPIQSLLALAIVGLAPNIPFINLLEFKYRRTCQNLTEIPSLSILYANGIRTVKYGHSDFQERSHEIIDKIDDIKRYMHQDARRWSAKFHLFVEKWVAVATLVAHLRILLQTGNSRLSAHFLAKFIIDIDELQKNILAMYMDRSERILGGLDRSNNNNEIRIQSLEILHTRASYIVGLLILRGRTAGTSQQWARRYFGIEGDVLGGYRSRMAMAMAAISVVLVAIVGLVICYEYILPLLQIPSVSTEMTGVSVYYALYSVLINGTIIWSIVAWRGATFHRGGWFRTPRTGVDRRSVMNYVISAGLCTIVSMIAGYMFRGILESTWLDIVPAIREMIPFVVVHSTIGLVAVWNIDSNYLDPMRSGTNKTIVMIIQTFVIGFLGWAAIFLYGFQYEIHADDVFVTVLTTLWTGIAVCGISQFLGRSTSPNSVRKG